MNIFQHVSSDVLIATGKKMDSFLTLNSAFKKCLLKADTKNYEWNYIAREIFQEAATHIVYNKFYENESP